MTKHKQLIMGIDQPQASMIEFESRVSQLEATIAHYIPEFARAIESSSEGDQVVLHQDAFAAGYHDDEYMLLGMAIKFAGLRGVVVNVIGKSSL